MRKTTIIWAIVFIVLSNLAFADYFYTPFNFDSPTNHSFTIDLDGYINVTLPNNFTLVSGNMTGNNSLSFVIRSPDINTTEVFIGQIYLNNSLYTNYYLLSVPDNKIVDTKVEIGHGDFNYIDSDGYIGTDNTLLFNIVRIWAMGSDILNEPAQNVNLNCTFPKIIPNTVDSKYTTTYNPSNISAEGILDRMEGASMFRIFVLSQEVDYPANTSYNVICHVLHYTFSHTEVFADIPNINLQVRSINPLIINMQNNSEYVTYTIKNDELYDLRNIEFLWKSGTNTLREELDELKSGESIQYNIATNESGNMTFNARFIPEWMFNSRSPHYYTQTSFNNYYTPEFMDSLTSSDYYNNQSVITDSIFETQDMSFGINILQNPPYSQDYQITYYFYNEEGELISQDTKNILGTGQHTITFSDDDLVPNGVDEDFKVYTIVSIKDGNDEWYNFPMERIGTIKINALTDNGARAGLYDVIVTSEYPRYDVEDTIKATITIKNTGDAPDQDTVLTYWLEDASGNRYGETKEQFLEVPVGTTTIHRELTLPLNSAPGEWKFKAEYETVVQPTVHVYDAFEVKEMSFWDKVNERISTFKISGLIGLLIGVGIFIILLLLIPTRRKKKWEDWEQQTNTKWRKRR